MKRENPHPRLCGKKKRNSYSHGFSSYEMESLTAIFETLLPSIDVNDGTDLVKLGLDKDQFNDAVKAFYKSSGSDRSIPDEAAEIIRKRGFRESVILVRVVLYLLSTRIGTVVLCGSECVDWKEWPFVSRFSCLTVDKREKILQKWCKASNLFFYLRLVFFFVKSLCLYLFLALVDEDSKNPAWEAIGYEPDTTTHFRPNYKHRPLDRGLIETINETPASFPTSLINKGVKVVNNNNNNDSHYDIQCDVVIIGSGSGGSVAAAILAKSGLKVLILEKGNYYTAHDYTSLEHPSMNELLEQGGMLPSTDGKLIFLAGKTVGGGTAVNWSASLRTPKSVTDEWSNHHGLNLFSSTDYTSAMDSVCERLGVTEDCEIEGFQNQVLRTGCERLGLKVNRVGRNSSGKHYCGSCQYGCRSGDKQGADLTWLVDCANHDGVILSGCKATRLMIITSNTPPPPGKKKSKRCVGVIAKSINNNLTKEIRITSRVVLSACGALFTPPLLIRSGLKNKHIGRNLHLHPSLMVWGYFPPQSEFKGNIYEGGLITSAHEFKHSENNNNTTTIALLETPALGPGSFAGMCPWKSGIDIKHRLLHYSRTSNIFAIIRDTGSGEVFKEGRISYNFTDSDKRNLRDGLRRAVRILVSAGAVEVGTYRSDGVRIRCDNNMEKVEEFVESVEAVDGPMKSRVWGTYSTAHQMGSCRMSLSEEDGGVDENGECWEVDDLYVCDGSLLPTAIGVNPMITIQATAYCVAKKLADKMNSKKEKDV